MIDPVFILGLSILLVAVSLTAVLMVALPAFQELARAARSAEKLFDTLRRELPPTLESIRLTGMEISDLTDDVSDGVKSAGQVVKRVDQSLEGAKKQAQKVQMTTRSVMAGMKAAWRTLTRKPPAVSGRRSSSRLSQSNGALNSRSENLPLASDFSEKLADTVAPTVGYPESTHWVEDSYPSPLALSSEEDSADVLTTGRERPEDPEGSGNHHYQDAAPRRNLQSPSEGSALNGE